MAIGVNQISSPIKFCFLIEANSKKKFERAVKIAFSYWGGIYFPILPLYKKMSHSHKNEYDIKITDREYYTNSINNFDPDVILFDECLDEDYIKSFSGDRVLLSTEDFLDDTVKSNFQYGISSVSVIASIVKNEFKFQRNDDLKLMILNTRKSSLFVKVYLGCFIDEVQDTISKQLNRFAYYEEPEVKLSTIDKFFPNDDITALEIVTYKINSFPEKFWYRGKVIYFMDENRLQDIVNYWNLRALGWHIAPVPLGDLTNVYFLDLLERFVKYEVEKSEHSSFINFQISAITGASQKVGIDKILMNLRFKVKGDYMLGFQSWFSRFWEARAVLEADKVLCEIIQTSSTYSQVDIKENHVKFTANSLPFKYNVGPYSKAAYKINLSFSYFDEYVENAGLVYGIDTIDWIRLTHSYGGDKWRLSKTGLNYFVRRLDDEIYFNIPKSKEFFRVYFAKRGNAVNETSNGRLANEVLKNIGGVGGIYFLKNQSSLKILELVEDGKSVNFHQLLSEVKKRLKANDNQEAELYIKRLLDNKIIEFGSVIQCEVCHQRGFYLPVEIKEEMVCLTCRNKFDLPMHKPNEIKWSYRGIGPFSKNNKAGGVMAVFLTLRLFREEFSDTSGNMSSLIGFELLKDKTVKEVDLAVMFQKKYNENSPPDLIFCECKTFKNFVSADADRMIDLGEEFPDSILTFATLKEELVEEEKKEILRVVNYFRRGVGERPINPVLILTANELLPDGYLGHFSEYENESKPYHRYNDWIGNLCEFTVRKHLGLKTWGEIRTEAWIEESKKQNASEKPHGFAALSNDGGKEMESLQ